MNQNKLTFQSENLQVDYISFKLKDVESLHQLKQIGIKCSSLLDCNYKILYSDNPITEDMDYSRIYLKTYRTPSWSGSVLSFPGSIANQFYNRIKKDGIPWKIFGIPPENIDLSRLDILYVQPFREIITQQQIEKYFHKCRAKSINRVSELTKNKRGICLKLGARRSSFFYRIYPKQNQLRFELEIKKFKKNNLTNAIEKDFWELNFSEMENRIVPQFVKSFFQRLDHSMSYAIWATQKYRKLFARTQKKDSNLSPVVSTYLNPFETPDLFTHITKLDPKYKKLWKFKDDEAAYLLILLFAFLSKLDNSYITEIEDNFESILEKSSDHLKDVSVQFPLIEFFNFIKLKNNNHHQRKKYKTFFRLLPNLLLFTKEFDDETFVSKTPVSCVEMARLNNKIIVQLRVSKKILNYTYPFAHSQYFLNTWGDHYQLSVKLMILRNFNRPSLIKKIPIEEFIHRYKNTSGTRKSKIKEYIVQALEELKKKKLIKSYYLVQTKKDRQDLKLLKLDSTEFHTYKRIIIEENI